MGRTRRTVLVAAALLATTAPATAAIPPDTAAARAARQQPLLDNLAADFVPNRDYARVVDPASSTTTVRRYCTYMGTDANALVARLERHRRGARDGDAYSPAEGAVHAKHIADAYYQYVGPQNDQGPCSWNNLGLPLVMYAAQSLAFAAHQYGGSWPADVRQSVLRAVRDTWHFAEDGWAWKHLYNGITNLVAAEVLAGEAFNDTALWQRGLGHLERTFDLTMRQSSLELNAPIYTNYHFPPLVAMQVLRNARARTMARILLDFELIFHGHLYLPGGGLGAPQARDYSGGALDKDYGLVRYWWLFTGEGFVSPDSGTVAASVDVEVPEAIRSLFHDKGEGYDFLGYADTNHPDWTCMGVSGCRVGFKQYPFGITGGEEDPPTVSPWHVVMLPGGDASLSAAYGHSGVAIHNSAAVYLKNPAGGHEILYHHQPVVAGDTYDTGGTLPTTWSCDPAHFNCELYDVQRLVYGRTLVQIWDPTLADKPSGVVRSHPYTQAFLPDFAGLGGNLVRRGAWRVGRLGDVYVGFRPLGPVAVDEPATIVSDSEQRTGTRIRMADGVSGSIIELATTADFPNLGAFADDLAARQVTFNRTGRWAEFQARDPETGNLVDVRLEYRPERRFIGGVEKAPEELFAKGLVHSRWVSFDPNTRVMRLERDCYERVSYDWQNVSITTEPAPEWCSWTQAGPIFSPVAHFGDSRNYVTRTADRWSVMEADGGDRFFLGSTQHEPDGSGLLGEWAVARERTFGNFDLRVSARTVENLTDNPGADYAVIFGWLGPRNYAYLLANGRADWSELWVVEDGVARSVAVADRPLIPDEAWHDLHLSRREGTLKVYLDGVEVMVADVTGLRAGRVGVGSVNDAALFDDLEVAVGWDPVGDVFSPVPHFGDLRNYVRRTADRWSVVHAYGDERLWLGATDYAPDESGLLGEWSVAREQTFGDFDLRVTARTVENLTDNPGADYAVIFGWLGPRNYAYLVANGRADWSELWVVEDGVARSVAVAAEPLIPDEGWHELHLSRRGDNLAVRLDGAEKLVADVAGVRVGRVGVGSVNDAALFDDLAVTVPDPPPGPDGGTPDAGPGEDGGLGDDGGAGPDEDGGIPEDGGVPEDAGPPADGGFTGDGGPGLDGGLDAGQGPDASAVGGCGCSADGAGPGGLFAGLLGLAGLLTRRRRRPLLG